MRKFISVLLISLCLLSMYFSVGSKIPVKANQAIFVPTDFPTIQSAIDNADSYATIFVAKGIYLEHLDINKSLSIVGEDRETTIIDGGDAASVISIAADSVTIAGFSVTKSVPLAFDEGIRIDSSSGILINNTKVTNTRTGLILYYCAYGVFEDNVITSNNDGLMLLYSNNNVFSDNLVSSNTKQGFNLYRSNNNMFFGNTISANGAEGLSISSLSSRNFLYHNNFQDPVLVFSESTNIWSRNGEGNYWRDYNVTEADLDGDGIGDKPHIIDESNQDDYPLMGTFSDFTIIQRHGTYHITVISNSSISNFGFEVGEETGNKMVTFNANGTNSTTGFCRMMIPTSLMDYPYTVLDAEGELATTLLSASNATNAYLYFAYMDTSQRITVISSTASQLYNDLLDKYNKLQTDFNSLNATYQGLLANYSVTIQKEIDILNATYTAVLNSFDLLLENFNSLQESYLSLNASLQKSVTEQAGSVQNIRNLSYIFAATTGAFLTTIAYLSNRMYANNKRKNRAAEEE